LVDNRIAVFDPPPAPQPVREATAITPAPELVIVKSPASVALHNADGRVKLLGSVPSDAARDAFGSAAQSVYGTGAVTNALTVDTATEPAEWQSKAADVLNALKSWGGASMVRADGTAVTLTGTAPSVQERDARGAAITKLFGPSVSVDNRIDVLAPVALALPPVDPATQAITCDTITRGVKIGFESGRSALDATGRRALDDIVACLTGKVYEVVGHTDSVGETEFNAVLSKRRAEVVAGYLKSKGVTAELRTSGAGSSQPVASNALEAGKAQNRRIEFKPL
jgi:outer membrane protein OmpA-like peptidoglycan-associated protein